jgi:DnaJ domain
LYEQLGVEPDADSARLRAAYVALARRHHPDRHVQASEPQRREAARRMRELNAAWAVLSDPGARAAYDASLRPAQPLVTSVVAASSVPRRPTRGQRFPLGWLVAGLVALTLIGVVAVALGAQGGDPAPVSVSDGVVAGACVQVAPSVVPVACTQDHDAVVVDVVDDPARCAAGTAVFTLEDRRVACLVPAA